MYLIPLRPEPNQTFRCTIPVDGKNLPLQIGLRFNQQARYWTMSVRNGTDGNLLVDNIPVITGEYPAANLLAPYSYLHIGSAVVVPVGVGSGYPEPGMDNLGTSFALVWGDTIA